MGKFSDQTIKSIINCLNDSFFLPDIQRDYVWLNNARERKIENLFDSILRGYPIGSFLFWKLKKSDIASSKNDSSEKLNFQLYRFQENYDEREECNQKMDIDKINCDELNIVLDGQQRLTSLYIGLKGSRTLRIPRCRKGNPNSYVEKKLLLNLRYEPQHEDPDDNYKFEFFASNEIPATDEQNFWFKVGDILEIESVLGYAMSNGLEMHEAQVLEKLQRAFCITPAISYFTETEKNLDKVLKIFIRVNSGGTQLSYSDLLMSILTATFSQDIKSYMNALVSYCREEGFGVFGRDQILKTCLLLTDCSPVFKLNNFSKSNISRIEDKWDVLTQRIKDAIHLVKDFGYGNKLYSGYIITVIALYLYRKGIDYIHVTPADKNAMKNFVRLAQIKSYFTTSLDTKLRNAYNQMVGASDFDAFGKLMAEKESLRITEDDINEMMNATYGSPSILPVLQILYPSLDYKNSVFHIDHIYPKSKFTVANKQLPAEYLGKKNELFNLQLLQGTENIQKRDTDPEVWMDAYFVDDPSTGTTADALKREYKKHNYIKEDFVLDWANIAELDAVRTARIRAQLEKVFFPDREGIKL